MLLSECFQANAALLMEGALGERLKREFHLLPDENVAWASLIYQEAGRKALLFLWQEYLSIAQKYSLPFLATTPTRRANQERVVASSYPESIIQDNVAFLMQMKTHAAVPVFAGGLMGCKGDAYQGNSSLSVAEAWEFHTWQAELFHKAGADFLYAGIMPALPEAIGMAKAMESSGLPYIISFMIRKNGCLLDGTTIHEAICTIDDSVVRKPLCYMTNCVHPAILKEALTQPFNQTPFVKKRFLGIQANTSPLPPEALDGASSLHVSDASDLADGIMSLSAVMDIKIYGGCCGTDGSHMAQIGQRISSISAHNEK